jgi:hypothetical protein
MPMTKAQIDADFGKLQGQIDLLSTVNTPFGGNDIHIRKNDLQKQSDDLDAEIASVKRETEQYNKSFQEKLYFKPVPLAGPMSTLQDFALAVFAIGWILLAAAVVAAGIFQPRGSWKRGVVLAALMFIITVVVHGLITSYL